MFNLFEGRGSDETLDFIEEKVRAGLWSWNLRTGQMRWSTGQHALLGLDVGSIEPSYDAHMALVHPEDRRALMDLDAILGEGLPFAREYRIIQPNGRMRWLAMRGEALLDSSGKPHRAIGLTFDITEQHEAQQGAVRDARFRSVVGVIAPISWTARSDGTITELMGWHEVTGTHAGEADDHQWIEAAHPDDRALTLDAWHAAIAAQDFFEVEHRLRSKDGTYRWFHTCAAPSFSSSGSFVGWQGVCVDLNTRKPKSALDPERHVITGAQIRASRGILKWSVSDLAMAAGVSPAIIRRIEDFDGAPARSDSAAESLRRALISGGVELIYPADGRPAVRPAPSRSEMHRPIRAAEPARSAPAAMMGRISH